MHSVYETSSSDRSHAVVDRPDGELDVLCGSLIQNNQILDNEVVRLKELATRLFGETPEPPDDAPEPVQTGCLPALNAALASYESLNKVLDSVIIRLEALG